MNLRRQIFLITLIGLLFTTACQKGCGKKAETVEKHEAIDEKEQAAAPLAVTEFPHLNLSGLTQSQTTSLTRLFNEEVCPCGCPKTFAQCLNMPKGCKAASALAQWAAVQLKEGAPENYLFRALSEEINTGFLAPAKTIDVKNAHRKGNPNASLTIVEFADFECPACKMASAQMREFMNEHKNEVQLYFMHFPLTAHPNAERAAISAEAAGKQGKFWEMHDMLFAADGPLTDDFIHSCAVKIFDKKALAQFEKDRADPSLLQKIKEHREYGINEIKLTGTPTFLFNGRPYNLSSAKDGYELRRVMEQLRSEMNCSIDK